MLHDDLVSQDLHSALKIVLGLEDGPGRIVRFQSAVGLPIEIAAVTLLVCVGELQQSLRTSGHAAYFVTFGYFRLRVMRAGLGIQTRLRTGKRLEK